MPNLIYCWEEFYRISPKNSKMIECSAMGLFVLFGSKIIANISYNHGIYITWTNMDKMLYNRVIVIDICRIACL